jgi:hypothetical protein
LTTLSTIQPRLYFASLKPEHHAIRASPVAVILFHRRPTSIVPPHNDTHIDKLADPLSLFEQLIGMWIHVNIRYFEILQHRATYELVYYKHQDTKDM